MKGREVAQLFYFNVESMNKDLRERLQRVIGFIKAQRFEVYSSMKRVGGVPSNILVIGRVKPPIKEIVYEILESHGISSSSGDAWLLE